MYVLTRVSTNSKIVFDSWRHVGDLCTYMLDLQVPQYICMHMYTYVYIDGRKSSEIGFDS